MINAKLVYRKGPKVEDNARSYDSAMEVEAV